MALALTSRRSTVAAVASALAAMAVAAQAGLAADHFRAKFTEHARDGGTGGAGG